MVPHHHKYEVPKCIICEKKIVPDALFLITAYKLASLHTVFYLWHLWNDSVICIAAWPPAGSTWWNGWKTINHRPKAASAPQQTFPTLLFAIKGGLSQFLRNSSQKDRCEHWKVAELACLASNDCAALHTCERVSGRWRCSLLLS